MTLTIHKEEDEQRQLSVKVEVAEDRVQQAMRQVARKLARDIHIPGFRRGKAPYSVVMRRVGRDALRAEAVDDIVPDIFEEVVEQTEADIYGQPRLEDMELEPLVLNFLIPLSPQVTLGDYRALRKEIEPIEIQDEAIDEALAQIQAEHEILEPVDRPVMVGDKVTLGGLGQMVPPEGEAEEVDEAEETEAEDETAAAADDLEVDTSEETADDLLEDEASDDIDDEDFEEEQDDLPADAVIFDQESVEWLIDSERLFFGQPFVDNLVGMSAGDEKTFVITFPEDFEEAAYAGKEARFEINVQNVHSRTLPELNDELAKEEGDYETLDELIEHIRTELTEQAEQEAEMTLFEEMVEHLLDEAILVYPPTAVESEIDDMVRSFKNQVERSGWQWGDFLTMSGQEEADIRENMRENAVEQVRRQLVLRQFVQEEKIRVSASNIDEAVEERVSRFENEELKESMREYFRSGSLLDSLSNEIIIKKLNERIMAIVTGNAPDLDTLAEADLDDEGEEE